MKKTIIIYAAVICFLLLFILCIFIFKNRKPVSVTVPKKNIINLTQNNQQTIISDPKEYIVQRVIDGDTLELNTGERVRLIGIDTPETIHPEVPVQRFGKEASQFLRQLAEGFKCRLEYEKGNRQDKYGRILAYVFVEGKYANAELIRRGYAYAYTRFQFSRMDEYIKLEEEARRKEYGMWNFSLSDGRMTNLINTYGSLSLEGRKKLDIVLKQYKEKYPLVIEGGRKE